MILSEHLAHFELIRRLGVYNEPFLMLGNQECHTGVSAKEFFEVDDYTTLDPDGGDIAEDLTTWTADREYQTVFNLGTIEHIWDAHTAFCNAAAAVAVGGHFIHHGPVGGYEGHGIHVTDWVTTLDFFRGNGFEIVEVWFSRQDGKHIPVPRRDNGQQIMWMVAKKVSVVAAFRAPQQVFREGKKI